MGSFQVVRVSALAALLAGMVGCQFPRPSDRQPADAAVDAPGEPLYAVRGTVEGLWTGASLQLELLSSPDQPTVLSVTSDGAFEFPPSLPNGRSFTVAIAASGQPSMHTCSIASGAGVIEMDQTPAIAVACMFDTTFDIKWSAPITNFAFSVGRTSYTSEVALGVNESEITLTGPSGIEWAVNNQAFSAGIPQLVSLLLEDNHVDVTVRFGALSKRYAYAVGRVDPVVNDIAYLKASNTTNTDRFGAAIAAQGVVVAVGAPDEDSASSGVGGSQANDDSVDSGAVYIFERDGLALAQTAYVKATPNTAGDHFGASIAISASLLVVGAPDDGPSNTGAVYVFRRGATGWTQLQRLTPPGAAAGLRFGASVAITGRWIAVGAPGRDEAYVYLANGTSTVWTHHETFIAPSLTAGDMFGASVAMYQDSAGDRLVVGAPLDDSAVSDGGAIHVFRYSGSTWAFEQTYVSSDIEPGDHFGSALAGELGRLVVGADGEDSGASNAGAVYVFEPTAVPWPQPEKLTSSAPRTDARLGASVAVRKDLVLAGAPGASAGATTLFRRIASSWATYEAIAPPAVDAGDEFGASVALSAQGIYVGAPREDGGGTGTMASPADNSGSDTGAVHGFF